TGELHLHDLVQEVDDGGVLHSNYPFSPRPGRPCWLDSMSASEAKRRIAPALSASWITQRWQTLAQGLKPREQIMGKHSISVGLDVHRTSHGVHRRASSSRTLKCTPSTHAVGEAALLQGTVLGLPLVAPRTIRGG